MLEPKKLKRVPVPDLARVPAAVLTRIVRLVDRFLEGTATANDDREIEQMVIELFDLSTSERKALNIGD